MATNAKQPEPEAPDNLAIWNALSRTDPKHTKQFKRAGGFTGTAIKPIWIVKMLTERFGACGTGWGMDAPDFQIVPGENREVLVYCTVTGWYVDGDRREVHGVGGDKVVTYIKANEQYNRPERWDNDDEAFKKAFTDAVGNAFKFIGVGADVHMGQFDDSKYVAEVAKEFAKGPPANDSNGNGKQDDGPFPPGPAKNKTELKTMMRELWREVEGCGDPDELDALLAAKPNVTLVTQLIKALPEWWEGRTTGNMPFDGLETVIKRKREMFELEAGQQHPFAGG